MRRGSTTTVYLLSGLTTAERRAVLRRLRLSARMGYCPGLPTAQLILALGADRIRTAAGHAGAVFRSHPAGSTVPVMLVSAGAIAFLLSSTVSIRVLQPPRSPSQLSPSFPAPAVSAIAAPGVGSLSPRGGGADRRGPDIGERAGGRAGSDQPSVFTSPAISASGTGSGALTANPGTSTGTTGSSTTGTSGTGSSGTGTGSSGTGTGGSGTGGGSGGTGGTGDGSGGGSGSPAPGSGATSPAAPASSPAAPATSPAAQPSTGSSGGSCLDLGPFGICLTL